MSSKREEFKKQWKCDIKSCLRLQSGLRKRDCRDCYKMKRAYIKYLEQDYKNYISIDKIEKWIEKIKKKSIPAKLMKATYWYRCGFNKVLTELKSLIAEVRGGKIKK